MNICIIEATEDDPVVTYLEDLDTWAETAMAEITGHLAGASDARLNGLPIFEGFNGPHLAPSRAGAAPLVVYEAHTALPF